MIAYFSGTGNSLYVAKQLAKSSDDYLISITKGRIPSFKTGTIGFLFNKFERNPKSFSVSSTCTSCGICEKVCPTKTIQLKDSLPTWNGDCAQCLACINYCPVKAINYGDKTKNKGRYTNPNIKIDEMKFR